MRQMLWSFATIRVSPGVFRSTFERAVRTLEQFGEHILAMFTTDRLRILPYYRQSWTSTCGPLAQLAEQRTLNPWVEGSIPSRLILAAWWNW